MRDQRYGVTAILIRTLALYHVNCRVKSLPPRHGNTCRTFYGYRCAAFGLTYGGQDAIAIALRESITTSASRAHARARFSIYILISRFERIDGTSYYLC